MQLEPVEVSLKKFSPTDLAIEEMQKQYLPLKINGIDDRAGYLAVREARLKVKAARIEVEKTRKELKEDALKYGRMVDGEAKRITAMLTPIEDHLEAQEKAVDDERERIKLEKERQEKEKLNTRIQTLVSLGIDAMKIDVHALTILSDEAFGKEVERAKAIAAERAKKQEEEQLAKTLEAERIARINAEQEQERARLAQVEREQQEIAARIKADQDAANAKLKADQEALAAKERAFEELKRKEAEDKRKAEELEVAKKKAAEEALAQEAWEKEERERELKRIASLRPDHDKLAGYAARIRELATNLPDVSDETAKAMLFGAHNGLLIVAEGLIQGVKQLQKGKQ